MTVGRANATSPSTPTTMFRYVLPVAVSASILIGAGAYASPLEHSGAQASSNGYEVAVGIRSAPLEDVVPQFVPDDWLGEFSDILPGQIRNEGTERPGTIVWETREYGGRVLGM